MYFNDSLMIEGAGAGIVLVSPTGERLKYVLQIHFPASNNAAEYEALLHGLRIAISLGIRRLVVRGDSEMIVNQVQKEYSCTSTKMSAYCQEIKKLEGTFDGLELTHVLRNDNNEADELAKMGSKRTLVLTDVFVQQLHQPTISEEAVEPAIKPTEAEVFAINPDWITLYLNYLLRDELPEDWAEAERIARRSRRYVVVGGRKKIAQGDSLRNLRKSRRIKNIGRQGFFWPIA